MFQNSLRSVLGWWLVLVAVSSGLWWLEVGGQLSRVRGAVDWGLNPVKQLLWQGQGWVGQQVAFLGYWQSGQGKVVFLEAQLSKAMEAEGELARLREENVSLRRLLEAPLSADWNFLPARVIGVYQHGWWMNQGRRNGVTEGMVVLVEGHLAGLVNLVEERRARVVAIDSDQHKLEVVIRSQQTSEVTGQGVLTKRGDRLVVEQILPVDEVYSGDLVLTKGSDQVLPDVPIGVISSVIQTEETALYQQVEVWWPVNRLAVDRLVVVYGW